MDKGTDLDAGLELLEGKEEAGYMLTLTTLYADGARALARPRIRRCHRRFNAVLL